MPFSNYKFSYQSGSKTIFIPTDDCLIKGEKLLGFIEKNIQFPDVFFHYKKGGHVAALHAHLSHKFFFKIDIQRFFYSISRNRAAAALHRINFSKARTYAKWSCVPNPYEGPRYSLPIGFVQSPALASLVLMNSPIMAAITNAKTRGVQSSLYLDDIVCSFDDIEILHSVFEEMLASCALANLAINPQKLVGPCEEITAFNCDLKNGFVAVSTKRIEEFFEIDRSIPAVSAFDAYCKSVSMRNDDGSSSITSGKEALS